MLSLTLLKAIMISIIFVVGLFGVLSPRLFIPYSSKLSYASLFSSGILLAAAVVHLLGDASNGLSQSPLPSFPWAYFLCGLSFYLLYFFERMVIHSLARGHSHSHSLSYSETKKASLLHTKREDIKLTSFAAMDDRKSLFDDQDIKISISQNKKRIFEDPIFDDHGEDILKLMKQKQSLSGIVLLIGLGFHSFLAGIGFGSSLDIEQAVALSIAITTHKYLAAFSLGCPFYKSGVPIKQHIIIALSFSIITPLGIAIGWILSNGLEIWISDIFVSIAAGSFIYVAIIEILVPEFSELKQREKLIIKTDRKIQSLGLEQMNIGKNTMDGIKQEVKNEVIINEKRRKNRIECMKSISVLTGFVLMSMLALWI